MSETGKKASCVRGWMVLVMFVAFPAFGWLVATVVSNQQPILYESTAVIELLPPKDPSQWQSVDSFMQTKVHTMRSGEVTRLAVEKMKAEELWGMQPEGAALALEQSRSIKRLGDSRMVKINVRHRSREDAKAVAEAIYGAYESYQYALARNTNKARVAALKDELDVLTDYAAMRRKYYLDVREKILHGQTTEYDPKVKYDAERERAQQELDYAKEKHEQASADRRKVTNLLSEAKFTLIVPQKFLIIHTRPVLVEDSVSSNTSGNIIRGIVGGFLSACGVVAALIVIRLIAALLRRI